MWLYLLLQGRSVASPLMHERLLKLPDGANQLTLQTAFHSLNQQKNENEASINNKRPLSSYRVT